MSDAISASVLRSVLRDVKIQREASRHDPDAKPAAATGALFSDTHAQLLATLPPTELVLLQSASVLVHRGAVKLVTAQPSQRSFFRVESLSRYHQQHRDGGDNSGVNDDDDDAYGSRYAHADTSLDASAISQPFDGSIARGPNYYNVLPHYCSCQNFHEHTVTQCATAMCKHMLAALLADATGQCQRMMIADLDFAKMLCAQLEPPASPRDRDTAPRGAS